MKRSPLALIALSCLMAAGFLPQQVYAVPGGEISTLQTGRYKCEKPGDITGITRIHLPEEDFTAITGSNYISGGKRGSYLLTGNTLVMTSGPLEGRTYLKTSSRYLKRVLDDGSPGEQRCILGITRMK